MPTRSIPLGEGWPRISSGTTASSPPGISTPGILGAGLQAPPDRGEHVVARLLDGDVVEHRDRVGPDADHVVHVHGDAVDPHRVEPARAARRRSASCRRRRVESASPALAADPQHVRVVAGPQRGARRAPGVDGAQHVHQRGDTPPGQAGVHTGTGVGGIAHAAIQHNGRRARSGAGSARRRPGRPSGERPAAWCTACTSSSSRRRPPAAAASRRRSAPNSSPVPRASTRPSVYASIRSPGPNAIERSS